MPMRAQFDIHGLSLDLSADHPLLFQTFLDELSAFRVIRRSSRRKPVRLNIQAISLFQDGTPYPVRLAPYREFGSQQSAGPGTLVIRTGSAQLILILDLKRRVIRAGAVPEPALLPDPAYHLCFSHATNLFFKERGLFFLHAGCVCEGKEGILLVGPGGCGKSSLSAGAVQAGFQFIGDEQPLLSSSNGHLKAYAFPRRIRLDRRVAAHFPQLKPLMEKTLSERIVFPAEKIRPGCVASCCTPRLMIFPRFRHRRGIRLTSLAPAAVFSRLLEDMYFIWYRNPPWSRISFRHLALFQRMVQELPAFTLEYGKEEMPRVPSLFRRLLRQR